MTDRPKPIGVDGYGGSEYGGRFASSRVAEALGKVAYDHREREFIFVGSREDVLKVCPSSSIPPNVRFECEVDEREGAIKKLAKMTAAGEICGFYTCENTRVVVPRIVHEIGLIRECERFASKSCRIPPLIAELPKDPFVGRTESWYLLDVGAGLRINDVEQALFYAYAGTGYAKIMGRGSPFVGLLNIGEESNKGDEVMKEAYDALSGDKNRVNFVGNVEPWTCVYDCEKGRESLYRPVDVAVTESRMGNIFIKTLPVGAYLLTNCVKHRILRKGKFRQLVSKYTTKADMERGRERLNADRYAGAPFICLNAPVVKGHGTTQVAGIITGLERLIECDNLAVVDKMRSFFSNLT